MASLLASMEILPTGVDMVCFVVVVKMQSLQNYAGILIVKIMCNSLLHDMNYTERVVQVLKK